MIKNFILLFLLSLSFIVFLSGAKLVSAAILNPYVVDEKPQVLFGDSTPVSTYFGLENYMQDYVGDYIHISFTYTHSDCSFAGYPPRLYTTNVDPRATSTPIIKSAAVMYQLQDRFHDPNHSTNWYLYDIQFDATGYTVVVKKAGTTEIENTYREIPGLVNGDWVSIANYYPMFDPPVRFSMAFTPVPVKSQQIEECCSNIVFLPGIKGSVLKTGSDTLWPPTIFSNDMAQLALDESGESVNDIYVDGVLDTFYGTPIYAPFSEFMDNLVAEGVMNAWLPLPYDWRFFPEKILSDGVKTSSDVINLIEEIETIASQSQTGQMTIIAHSMGGLMGKAIIKKLEEEGKANLIDSFVMVGTPQLGTPQAAAALLHGDGEGIVAGFIVGPITARAIAQNMPSAYNLLPSLRYFEEVIDPVITFDPESSFTQEWRDFWGEEINIYPAFLSFVTGTGASRTKPEADLLRVPEVLRSDLMANAASFHNEYDNYIFPNNIRVVQVAGWGRPTTKAINYRNNHSKPSYEIVPTVEGDKTVVYPSAISSIADETYFFDLAVYNALEDVPDFQHRDLLSYSPIQNLIRVILKEENILTDSFVKISKPEPEGVASQLIVSTYSPVILGVYDEFGNFTGIDPNQDLSADILLITEDIPGSTFLYTSGSQNIFLPKDGTYNFVYKGTGEGPTTIEIQDFVADVTTQLATYSDIPTTQSTSATFAVNSQSPEKTIIKIDTDNDVETDELVVSDETDISDLLTLLKEKIQSLDIKDKLKNNLLKNIENLKKKIEKKKRNDKSLISIKNKINNIINKAVKKGKKGKIADSDVREIINLLEQIESAL